MMRSTLMFEAGNSPNSLLHLTARYWHRSSFHWWPHLEYRVIQLGWMITRAKIILLLLSAFSSSSSAVPMISLHRNVAFHLEALRPSENQDFHIPREVGFLDRDSAADKRYTRCPKKEAKRMLLKPRCTRSITSSRHPSLLVVSY